MLCWSSQLDWWTELENLVPSYGDQIAGPNVMLLHLFKVRVNPLQDSIQVEYCCIPLNYAEQNIGISCH